ncbi:hypothetical protein [Streptomyces sp. NPDC057939]|uniref:hypothetical protein n=1 Tax=Streptomyces sp. NPDC057939 TaxID=3346284 RepID=UPI0036E41D3A
MNRVGWSWGRAADLPDLAPGASPPVPLRRGTRQTLDLTLIARDGDEEDPILGEHVRVRCVRGLHG